MISCWSASCCMVLLRSGAGGEQCQLFAVRQHLSFGGKRAFTSSWDAGAGEHLVHYSLDCRHQGNCPVMARFISQPVMIIRLISFVPSNMRLMRESRYGRSAGYSST